MQKYGLSQTDYIKYKDYFFRMLENMEKEETVQQEQSKNVNQRHDKSIKDILKDTSEMSEFLEQFMDIKVDPQDLEEQKNNYINSQFKKRESDIIYKIKEKDIYILIEHQSKVDNRMPRRMFEYCMLIMMAIENSKKEHNEYEGTNPIVVPIVIYTGIDKWNVKTSFSDTQKTYEGYESYKINLNYKLIDINKYTKNELKKKNTKLANMMIFEKCGLKEELKEEIIELILLAKEMQDTEMINWIKRQIKYVFSEKLGEDGNKILNVLERGEMSEMEELFERIEANEKAKEQRLRSEGMSKGMAKGIVKGLADGIAKTMTNMIKNMLEYNEDDEKIMKYTNAKKEDIDRVRKELGM